MTVFNGNRKGIMMSLVNQTFPLFKPPYVLNFLTCAFLHFGTFSVAGGMAIFLPDTLNRLSKARQEQSDDLRICDVLQMGRNEKANETVVTELVSFNLNVSPFSLAS